MSAPRRPTGMPHPTCSDGGDRTVILGYAWHAPSNSAPAWTAVVGRGFVVLLDAGASEGTVAGLWRLADRDDVSIESLVGGIPLAGASAVSSYAAIVLRSSSASDGTDGPPEQATITSVVRGRAALDVFSVGGARRFSAGGVEPWVLADFHAVTGVIVGGDDRPAASVLRRPAGSLPVGTGVVGAESLVLSLSREVPAAPDSRTRPPAVRTEPLDRVAPGRPVDLAELRLADPDDTILRPRRGAGTTDSSMDEDTVLTARHDPRPAADDHDDRGASDDVRPEPTRYRLILPDGSEHPIEAPVILGRRPIAPRIDRGVVADLVTVRSPTGEVSGTHVRFVREGDAVVVTDLRSTNGTVVERAGTTPVRLRPGESLTVLAGTDVRVGDGNIIRVDAVGR